MTGPIIDAGDDGEILDDIEDAVPPGAQVDRSEDGSITSIITPEGEWEVHVDPSTEFGEKLAWIAGHRGESPEECLQDAIREFIEERAP